jgi:probable F420-dependent oxidoreductase
MKFGFSIPTRGPIADRASVIAIARRGESLGFDHVTVNDHIVIPRQTASTYPYSRSGDWSGGRYGEALEQLSMLAFLAGVTERIRLLTAVMVVPYRNPVTTARMLATADHLSEGRLTVGCGVGWMKEEFEALGTAPFAERGRVTDEYIRIFKEIWTSETPEFQGDYNSFADISALPHPVQSPHPPLWIGGESGPALRRAVQLGDGWFPIGNNPRHPLNTVEKYRAGCERLNGFAEKAGRDPATLDLAYGANWPYGGDARETAEGERLVLTGSDAAIVEDVGSLAALGVEHVIVSLQAGSLPETLDLMERFAGEVVAKS